MNKKYATKAEINAAAHGRWREILEACGIPSDILDKKHHPCPSCGGTDRFRFTDGSGSSRGSGVWICNQCKPEGGSPFDLLIDVCGYSLNEAKDKVAALVGLAHGTLVDKDPKPLPPPAPPKEDERDLWKPIIPVPEYALKSMTFNNGYRQSDDLIFKSVFRDGSGAILGGVARFKKSDGGKIDMPYTFCENTKTGEKMWRWRCWENPRPLYGLDALSSRPTSPVLVVEGEKCKNAADAQDYGYAVLTWHGGCNNWDKSDWSAVVDRDVVLWPDCDSLRQKLTKKERDEGVDPESKPFLPRNEQGGMKAMLGIADVLTKQNCRVWLVNIPEPGRWPHGFDIADAIADGGRIVNPSEVLSRAGAADWLVEYVPEAERSSENFPAPYQEAEPEFEQLPESPEATGNQGGAGDIDDEFLSKLQKLKSEFGLVEGKDHGVNRKTGVTYTRKAMTVHFGKEVVDAWYEWGRAPVLTMYEINRLKKDYALIQAVKDDDTQDMMERFIYLDGSASIWDNKLWRVVPEKAARLSMTPDGFKIWVNSPSRIVKRFDRLVFEPGRVLSDDYINIFRGMPIEPKFPILKEDMPKTNYELYRLFPEIKPILNLINHLCNGDCQQVEYLLNWLAYPLQKVGAKMTTAVVMHGHIHGAGKSFFFEEIVKPMYGEYGATYGQEDLESNYTANRSGKMFGIFEEVYTNQQKYNKTGSQKHMITGKTMRVERKFQDAYEEANHMNCVFLSNESQPFKIEENDRRYFVVWPEKKLDKKLRDEVLDCIGNDGVRLFYSFLLCWNFYLTYGQQEAENEKGYEVIKLEEPVRFDPNTPPPMTAAKQNVISYGRYAWQTFYSEWAGGGIKDLPFCCCITDDLWLVYKGWCRQNGERETGKTKFLQHIAEKMPRARRRWRSATKEGEASHQNWIFKTPNWKPKDGLSEAESIGNEVIEFRSAGWKYRGAEVV